MKTLTSIFTLVFLFVGNISFSQWEPKASFDTQNYSSFTLEFIDFADEENGIVIARYSSLNNINVGVNKFLITHDGGETWNEYELPFFYDISAVECVSDSIIYVFGVRLVEDTVNLYRSRSF